MTHPICVILITLQFGMKQFVNSLNCLVTKNMEKNLEILCGVFGFLLFESAALG